LPGGEGPYSVPTSGYSRPVSRPVIRPDSGIYSEVVTGHRLAPVTEEADSAQPLVLELVILVSLYIICLLQQLSVEGREAWTESQTNLATDPQVMIHQAPLPVQGPEGVETGLDSTPLIYASVSEEHKQQKRFGGI